MKNRCLLTAASVFLLLTSCQNELPIDLVQSEITPIAEQQEEFVPNDGMIQLGRKLENPYSLENMRRALELLPSECRSGFSAEDIQPTHLYVKFKPKNVDELDAMLWSDSTLHFYDHPLDYEQLSGGCHYHDPSLPEGVPTYYYVSIPVGHPIPEVCEYEILEELYIPDELTDYTRSLSPAFINAIVKKSFEITGNEYECDAVATRSDGQTRASHTYSGTIRAWDDLMNDYVPVPGALIRCTRWFTTVTAVTNINGYYSMTRGSTNAYNYEISWERDNQYDIRDGEFDQAITDGPKQTAGWSLDIGTSKPKDLGFATMTRAAYRYFYGNTGGFDRAQPTATGDLKICFLDEYSESMNGYFDPDVTFEIFGDIFIYGKQTSSIYKSTSLIYSSTAHEMAHANQCIAMTTNEFKQTTMFIKESWAMFVESFMFYLEYGELGLYNMSTKSYEDIVMTQMSRYDMFVFYVTCWPYKSNLLDYSCLFMDLYDDFNQRVERNSNKSPNDIISGYTPSVLNFIINQSHNIAEVKTHLKANLPQGVTAAMVDELVDFFVENHDSDSI